MLSQQRNRIGLALTIFTMALLIGVAVWRNWTPSLTTEYDRLSYAIGHQIGTNLKQAQLDLNPNIVAAAIEDVLRRQDIQLTPAQMQEVISAYQMRQQKKQAAEAEKNLLKSNEFLQKNAQRPEIKVLPSGLQYEVLKTGKGKTPQTSNIVVVRYGGKLISGELFDTTDRQGKSLELKLSQVFPGLKAGLMLMNKDSRYRLYIPPSLAYGVEPRPGIPPQSALIYDIDLIDIK